jgi:ferredoxin-NADP reductase
MKLTLANTKDEIGNVRTFVFKPESPISWTPGQFIHYTLPHDDKDDRGDERWFTISSAPFEKNIQITTRIFEKPSSFKQRLLQLQPGDTIEAGEPDGDFTYGNESRNHIFVAGGIGITPFRSIITELHHQGKDFNIELLYANREADNILFEDELEAIAAQHDGFNIHYFIGDNVIDEAVLVDYKNKFDDPMFYVSGPEPMVEAFEKTLTGIGVSKENLHFDYFPGYTV